MWQWLMVLGAACFGYAAGAAVFGLSGKSAGARIAWAFVLGAAGVFVLIPVVVVFALSGGLPRAASIPGVVWAAVLGVVAAAVRALFVSRGDVRQWIGGGGIRRGAVSAVGAVLALVVGVSIALVASPNKEKPVAELMPVAPAVVQVEKPAPVVSCDCAAGAVCVGPKGGRYCLRPDGSKKYTGAGS